MNNECPWFEPKQQQKRSCDGYSWLHWIVRHIELTEICVLHIIIIIISMIVVITLCKCKIVIGINIHSAKQKKMNKKDQLHHVTLD